MTDFQILYVVGMIISLVIAAMAYGSSNKK